MTEIVTPPADVMQKLVDTVVALFEAVKAAVDALAAWIGKIWEAVQRAVVPPKWWHLYKHAKKARIRKKYAKRIQQAVAAALRTT